MRKIYFTLLALATVAVCQAGDVTKSGHIKANETWSKSNTYFLDGFVFVDENVTLTIEAGTVIKGKATPSTTDYASALMITRGGKIMAEGTADAPIIFTSEYDDLTKTDDIDLSDVDASRSLWGGVIILGKAPIADVTTESSIEGLPVAPETTYGGNDPHDNSGVLKYVSIRHGGAQISAGNEINGLTVGAVGDGTIIEHLEVLYNYDDGIEFFGGTVNIKWAIMAFCGDDGFDWDMGWRGKGQFWFVIEDPQVGDHGGEWDGGVPDDNPKYSNPTVYNFTFIGSYDGKTVTDAVNDHGIIMRDGTAGTVCNGIVAGYNHYALEIEENDPKQSSYLFMLDGKVAFKNNIWHDFGAGSTWDEVILPTPKTASADHLTNVKKMLSDNNNELAASGIDVSKRDNNGAVNAVPKMTDLAGTKSYAALPSDPFFSTANYIGAFEPGKVAWANGWTGVEAYGIADFTSTSSVAPVATNVKEVTLYPNPASNNVRLAFSLENNDQVQIQIVDLTGKVVMNLGSKNFTSGYNSLDINTSAITSGVYFINMVSDNTFATQRLVIE
ncbi:T9SS type A sorting domain-containing protein [bacterium]|nr:T9SS type A sorting domain-containing protein [bacterium]